ncbi:MAG TPA: NHL repeat-containing protein [bacterium]|jgi:DNA-binding beta-propeller fold protein YncE|nr:NHL repeat-containing protein [bacterium]
MVEKSKKKPARSGRGKRLAMILLFLVLLAGAGTALFLYNRGPAEIPLTAVVAQTVGTHGIGHGGLDSPRCLAIAPDGDLYVVDLGNSRIEVFSAAGAYKFAFGVKGAPGGADKPGEFNEPSGIAIGKDGTVYVSDAWNARVQRFSPKGKPEGEFGGPHFSFFSPRSLTIDGNGMLYVADTGNSVVKVIDTAKGNLDMVLGSQGSGDGGQSHETFGMAVDSHGDIFVADHGNHRIHKFSAAGVWIKDRKVLGWAESDPFWPQLAIDKQGLIYAGDSGNGKIWIYDSDLNYRGTLEGPPQGEDPLSVPVGLAFSPKGDLWVSDMGANHLVKLAPFTVPAPLQ